ncbi:MAG: Tad domain-containing protein [Candidatus Dormiibacterota bacterium]
MAILFALAAVAIIGMAGLALDAGLSYLGQTGLQSASDNASLAVARMLAMDYTSQSQVPAPPLPWTYSQMVSTVQSMVGSNGAGGTRATSYEAYFTSTSGASICKFWPTATATCPTKYPLSGGLPESSAGTVSASGALISPTNTHSTNILGLLGIGHASETAPATAVFGVVQGVPAATVGYAVYDIYCPTEKPLALYETITYYTPQWKKSWPCANLGDAQFKGDLHSPLPDPITVPGWISAKSGSGTVTPVTTGQVIIIPMIDCVDHGSQCTEPTSPGVCPPALPSGLPTSGKDVMCAVGLIALKALDNCNTGSVCTGEVVPFLPGQSGILICPTTADPACGNESGTQGSETVSVELLK